MTLSSIGYFWAATASISTALFFFGWTISTQKILEAPRLGLRGYKRELTRQSSSLFAAMEPAIRFVGGWFAALPLDARREKHDRLITEAGDHWGVSADELMAIALLCATTGLLVGIAGTSYVGVPAVLASFTAVLGAVWPASHLGSIRQTRRQSINRGLPAAIEVIALCMSAGLDFPGAIAKILRESPVKDAPINEELRLMLRQIRIGHTRARVLRMLADRVPSDAVHDFVASVIQAERKGNPLSEVLRIQARVLRTRRSIRAEELAAKASLMMIGPMVLLLMCTLLLIGGPLLMDFFTGEVSF